MTKRFLTILALCCITFALQAQDRTPDGGITPQMLEQIKKAWQGTPQEKAMRNIMTHIDLSTLAANQENEKAMDMTFSHRVPSKGITDQLQSGRCWLFTGLNVLRSQVIAKHDLGAFQFSQCYSFFWDQLEKANLFLQLIIDTRKEPIDSRRVSWLFRNSIGDGGQYTGVSENIMKYGLVPKEVMPETFASNKTSKFTNLLKQQLCEYGMELRQMMPEKVNAKDEAKILAKMHNRKVEMLGYIYKFLVMNLGEPPTHFTWTQRNAKGEVVSTKEYTPMEFYNEFVGLDLKGDYVMVMNDPSREYYQVYEIDYDRHSYDGGNWLYLNLPIDEVKKMAIESIKDNNMMYFSCDVAKFLNKDKGTLDLNNFDYASLLGTSYKMDKKQRIQTGQSGSSHAMTLVAVDLDENGNAKKWMVENSWGNIGYNGHLVMTDEWFNEYMFRVVVNKKYISPEILKLLDKKAILLPPWDPMFAPDVDLE